MFLMFVKQHLRRVLAITTRQRRQVAKLQKAPHHFLAPSISTSFYTPRLLAISPSFSTLSASTETLLDPDLLTSPEPPVVVQGHCTGCGAHFQHDDTLKPGFIPAKKLADVNSLDDIVETSPTEATTTTKKPVVVCQRCYHLTHYGDTNTITADDPLTAEVRTRSDVVEHIKWIDAFPPTALCVKVIDALDLHGTIAPQLVGALGSRRVLLAINKADLLPTSLTTHELQEHARKVAREAGVKNVVGCVATSAVRGTHGTTELTKQIKMLRQGRSVYMVGVTNVGKSTLFNTLKQPGIMSKLDIELDKIATVSSLPGTTMSPLKVRFGKGSDRWDMYDTPGIVVNREKHDILTDAVLRKQLVTGKTIKPKVFSVQHGKSLFFGGIWRMDISFDPVDMHADDTCQDGTPPRLLLIWNGHLAVHPTSTKNAEALMERQAGKLLVPALFENDTTGATDVTGITNAADAESTNAAVDTQRPRELTPTLEGNIWDLASFDIQDRYEQISYRVSERKKKRKERQRTPLMDIDMGGFGWVTVATSYDDYMSVRKRVRLLQRAKIKIWGQECLKPSVRQLMIPSQAGTLRSKHWKTI